MARSLYFVLKSMQGDKGCFILEYIEAFTRHKQVISNKDNDGIAEPILLGGPFDEGCRLPVCTEYNILIAIKAILAVLTPAFGTDIALWEVGVDC